MSRAEFYKLVFGENEMAASWLRDEERIVMHEPFTSLLIMGEDRIHGVVIFNNKTDHNIELSFSGVGLVTRRIIRFICAYCFIDNGCLRITCRTNANNERAIEAMTRIGFVLEGCMRNYYGKDDALIFGLLKNECTIWNKSNASPTTH